jgi:peptidyl-prolyl cis-trans isomerase D
MLASLRKNANSWIITLLFAVIIFVFAINFGPWAGRLGHDTSYAAKVNGQVITIPEFQSAYSSQMRLMQMFRPGYTPEQAEKDGLRALVLDHLVSQELLAQLAESNNLAVTDHELVASIKKRIQTDPDKALDADTYHRWVYGNFQMSEGQFEAQLKREMLAERMVEVLSTGVHVSDADLKSAFDSKNDQTSITFIRINPSFFPAPSVPADKDLSAWAKSHEADLKAYYDKNSAQFHTSMQVHARHILAKADARSTPEQKAAAKKKIEDALKRVTTGKEDFATVAKAVSEDGSASTGGDLGFFGKGAMVPSFEEAAFRLKPNQISGIVESPFGYHIIKAEAIKPAVDKSFDDAKADIVKLVWTKERQMDEAKKYAEAIMLDVKAGKKLDQIHAKGLVKKEAGASVSFNEVTPILGSTNLFSKTSRFVPGLGLAPEVVAQSFKLSAQTPHLSEPIVSNDNLYIVELKERKKPDPEQFAKDKDALRASMVNERKRDFLQSYVELLKKDAKIVNNPSVAAGLPMQQMPFDEG